VRSKMREQLEYRFVKLFLWLAKILPASFIYSSLKGLTLLIYRFDKKRRDLTIKNLSMAFPDKNMDEIEALSKDVYIELSKTVSEILLMFVDKFDIDAAVINLDEASQKIKRIASRSTKGIILITAHFSNWELGAHFLAKHGLPALAVGRKGNNKLIEENITTPFRKKYGNGAVSKKKAMLSLIKTLKSGGNIGLLIDQKSGAINSAKVDFFGKKAETTLSVASMKLRLDPMVLPIFIVRQEDGRYEMIINEPIDYIASEIEDGDKKLEAMTLKYNQAIEEIVRKYPQQWFWMHNRWRI